MHDGFVKTASATTDIRVADVHNNANGIIAKVRELSLKGAKVIVFPELCISGYTCGDLFLQKALTDACLDALEKIARETKDIDAFIAVGLPVYAGDALYNCGCALCHGKILGFVPKINIPNYSEFYELRHFTSGKDADFEIVLPDGAKARLNPKQIFVCDSMPDLKIGMEICEDLWVADPPSTRLALNGATLILNLSASDELVGKNAYRRNLVSSSSARLMCAYAYADAGFGESTTDMVFCGQNIIAENGKILAKTEALDENSAVGAVIDVAALMHERRRANTYLGENDPAYAKVSFSLSLSAAPPERFVDPMPFVPSDKEELGKRCEEILTIQALGLKKRLHHTGCKNVVLGLSGGLDSTLAYLVAVRAFDMLNLDRKGILAVTMPCFGTTKRTHDNALILSRALKTDFKEVNIENAVRSHFADIGHSEDSRDVTYENSQARERTQALMDLANKCGGLVIGTGDLSELAMGWATYNGDHMSMYGVNASVPKTLVRHLVHFVALNSPKELKECLLDILDTPVSPELLPPKDGVISQQTEDIIGPYELHDFFLYYVVRYGFSPTKIFRLARAAFKDKYSGETVKKWLEIFLRRFFAAQFKRSCLPDGPKVGSVALSPRGDWRMPSDGVGRLWIEEAQNIEI